MSNIHPGIAISNPDAHRRDDRESALSRDEQMSAQQAAELISLAQRAEEPDAYSEHLTRLEAQNRIALLKRKLDG